jgi:hypothetical protein
MGGIVTRGKLACGMFAALFYAAAAQAGGTDIIRKPSNWRGTLLEGTDALIATEKYGYPLFIQSGENVGKIFEPSPVTGERVAAEFKKLCLDTNFEPAKLAAVAPTSSLALANRQFVVTDPKNGSSFAVDLWHSPEARAQIWSGDASALAGKSTQSRWRNGATMSDFRKKDALTPACNLTVMTTGLHDPNPFIAAMNAITGNAPVKSVVKAQWADGNWRVPAPEGGIRIYYSMTDLDRSEQLVHVAVSRDAAKE